MLYSLTSAVVEDKVDGEAVGHGAQGVDGGHVTAAGGEAKKSRKLHLGN